MNKKWLSLALSLFCIFAVLPSAAFAADSSITNVVKAYKSIIDSAKVWDVSPYASVAFFDVDGDTLPELFIGTNGANAALVDVQVWTYRNGAAKSAGTITWGLAAYAPGLYATNKQELLVYDWGESVQSVESIYYTLDATGSLVKSNNGKTFSSSDLKAGLLGNVRKVSNISMSKQGAKDYLSGFDRFFDVAANQYYSEPVKWAVENNITNGTGTYSFSPELTCTRAQIITFLWRAAGSPKLTLSNPFADVKSNDYFYDSAIWAANMRMVTGNSFAGSTPCTRASAVTYIWQCAGSPPVGAASFADVPATASYSQAVAWAVKNGITNGTGANQFSPDAICTRGQIVTFLYRARNIQTDVPSTAGWSDAYKEFLFTQSFLTSGQEYSSSGTYLVTLYDMDCDGTPELKIDNGEIGRAVRHAYIYTYAGGEIKYLGIGPTDASYDPSAPAGIYGYYRLAADEINCTLYTKDGLSIKTDSRGTYTDFTWPSNLKTISHKSIDSIRDMGWENYLSSLGI